MSVEDGERQALRASLGAIVGGSDRPILGVDVGSIQNALATETLHYSSTAKLREEGVVSSDAVAYAAAVIGHVTPAFEEVLGEVSRRVVPGGAVVAVVILKREDWEAPVSLSSLCRNVLSASLRFAAPKLGKPVRRQPLCEAMLKAGLGEIRVARIRPSSPVALVWGQVRAVPLELTYSGHASREVESPSSSVA